MSGFRAPLAAVIFWGTAAGCSIYSVPSSEGGPTGGTTTGGVGAASGSAGASVGGLGGGVAGSGGGSGGTVDSGGSVEGGQPNGEVGDAGAGGAPPSGPRLTVTLSATRTATAAEGPDVGGTPYADHCPEGGVLVGFEGLVPGRISELGAIRGICATLSVSETAPYAVTTTTSQALPLRGEGGPIRESGICPENQVVVGFLGRKANFLEALIFQCASLTVSGDARNYSLVIGQPSDSALIGGELAGTEFAPKVCAPGEVAVSQLLRAGAAIDQLALACSSVTIDIE